MFRGLSLYTTQQDLYTGTYPKINIHVIQELPLKSLKMKMIKIQTREYPQFECNKSIKNGINNAKCGEKDEEIITMEKSG